MAHTSQEQNAYVGIVLMISHHAFIIFTFNVLGPGGQSCVHQSNRQHVYPKG